jgi:hypothetical protein
MSDMIAVSQVMGVVRGITEPMRTELNSCTRAMGRVIGHLDWWLEKYTGGEIPDDLKEDLAIMREILKRGE